jgi:hypothetical protein
VEGKASLFQPIADGPEEVTLTTGQKIKVRGLSRNEQLQAVKSEDITANGMPRFERTAIIEARIVAAGMVEPKLTFDEVRKWQQVPGRAADINAVSTKIQELSGMLPGAPKSGLQVVPGPS